MDTHWSLYVLRCGDGSLYTGITNNLTSRIKIHQVGKGAAYTRAHLPVALVFSQGGFTRSEALKLEAKMKKLNRQEKEKIVACGNLSSDLAVAYREAVKSKGKHMKINIGLSEKDALSVVKILNGVLADEVVLSVSLRNYHWNVIGLNFSEYHKFFETQYEEVDEAIDDIAERVRALGETPYSTLKAFLSSARLVEPEKSVSTAKQMLTKLLNDHESLIRQLRSDVEVVTKLGDAGTGDFLTGLLEQHEKMAWMVRATLGE